MLLNILKIKLENKTKNIYYNLEKQLLINKSKKLKVYN